MASELRVDKIIPTTGVPTNGTGGVIQTVYSQFKSPATASTTSTSFVDTGISATITPKFATSKIFVSGSSRLGLDNLELQTGSTPSYVNMANATAKSATGRNDDE